MGCASCAPGGVNETDRWVALRARQGGDGLRFVRARVEESDKMYIWTALCMRQAGKRERETRWENGLRFVCARWGKERKISCTS